MNGIKRLEELETKYSTLTVSSEKNGAEYTEVDIEDLVFLIQNGFKQAERVQELENHIDHLYDNNVHLKGDYRLQEQNKRYRETIEEAIEYANSPKILTSPAGIEKILSKALEGEE